MALPPSPVSPWALPLLHLKPNQLPQLEPAYHFTHSMHQNQHLPGIRELLTPQNTPPEMGKSRQSCDTLSIASDVDYQSPDPVLYNQHNETMRWRGPIASDQHIGSVVSTEFHSRPDIKRRIEAYRTQTNRIEANSPTDLEYALTLLFAESYRRQFIQHSPYPNPTSVARKLSSSKPSPTRAPLKNLGTNGSKVQKKRASSDAKPSSARSNKRNSKPYCANSNADTTKSARAKSTKPRIDETHRDVETFAAPALSMCEPMTAANNVKKFTGGSNDLSSDPEHYLLEPAELIVAEKLSLTCAKYLLTRGQILRGFVENISAAVTGKQSDNWNKTAAQKVCNIDVNKASCLFQFFSAVGWFKREHYLHLISTGQK